MTQNWELCIEYNCCFHTNMKYAREYNIFSKVFVFYEQTSFMKKYILYFDTVFVKYLFCFIYFPICDYCFFFYAFYPIFIDKNFYSDYLFTVSAVVQSVTRTNSNNLPVCSLGYRNNKKLRVGIAFQEYVFGIVEILRECIQRVYMN